MKILFATSSLARGKDGVGDYTRMLAEACMKRGGDVRLLALNDSHLRGIQKKPGMLRLGPDTPWEERLGFVWDQIRGFEPDRISLQFVAYGFGRRGIDFALPRRLGEAFGRKIDHLMFHELWVGEGERAGLKTRMTGILQRAMIRQLLRVLKPAVIHTSNGCYAARLRAIGIDAQVLPLFGAVPVAPDATDGKTRPPVGGHWRAGIFGTLHPVWPPSPLLDRLAQLPGRVSLEHAGRIGEGVTLWESIRERYAGRVELVRQGEMEPAQLADWFRTLDFGIATTPWDIIGKSASVAAMLEHGLPVVVNRDDVHFRGWREPGCEQLILAGPDLLDQLARRPRMRPASRLDAVTDQFLGSLGWQSDRGRAG